MSGSAPEERAAAAGAGLSLQPIALGGIEPRRTASASERPHHRSVEMLMRAGEAGGRREGEGVGPKSPRARAAGGPSSPSSVEKGDLARRPSVDGPPRPSPVYGVDGRLPLLDVAGSDPDREVAEITQVSPYGSAANTPRADSSPSAKRDASSARLGGADERGSKRSPGPDGAASPRDASSSATAQAFPNRRPLTPRSPRAGDASPRAGGGSIPRSPLAGAPRPPPPILDGAESALVASASDSLRDGARPAGAGTPAPRADSPTGKRDAASAQLGEADERSSKRSESARSQTASPGPDEPRSIYGSVPASPREAPLARRPGRRSSTSRAPREGGASVGRLRSTPERASSPEGDAPAPVPSAPRAVDAVGGMMALVPFAAAPAVDPGAGGAPAPAPPSPSGRGADDPPRLLEGPEFEVAAVSGDLAIEDAPPAPPQTPSPPGGGAFRPPSGGGAFRPPSGGGAFRPPSGGGAAAAAGPGDRDLAIADAPPSGDDAAPPLAAVPEGASSADGGGAAPRRRRGGAARGGGGGDDVLLAIRSIATEIARLRVAVADEAARTREAIVTALRAQQARAPAGGSGGGSGGGGRARPRERDQPMGDAPPGRGSDEEMRPAPPPPRPPPGERMDGLERGARPDSLAEVEYDEELRRYLAGGVDAYD